MKPATGKRNEAILGARHLAGTQDVEFLRLS
jgi:hypothetical protein